MTETRLLITKDVYTSTNTNSYIELLIEIQKMLEVLIKKLTPETENL